MEGQPATLSYSDQPPGSRLVVQESPDALTISILPRGPWFDVKRVLYTVAAFALVMIPGPILESWNAPAGSAPPSPSLSRILVLVLLVGVFTACAGWVLRGQGCVVTVGTEQLSVRHYSRRQCRTHEWPLDDVGRVFKPFLASPTILDKRGRLLTRILIVSDAEARWIVDMINRRLGRAER